MIEIFFPTPPAPPADKTFFDLVPAAVAVAAIGALWQLLYFFMKRDIFPKAELSLEANLIDRADSHYLFEFVAILHNKGLVRHYINTKHFILKVRYLTEADLSHLTNNIKIGSCQKGREGQKVDFYSLCFPNVVKPGPGREIHWLPEDWKYMFVDGNAIQRVSLPLAIPAEAQYLLVKAIFRYKEKSSHLHTAQLVLNLKRLVQA